MRNAQLLKIVIMALFFLSCGDDEPGTPSDTGAADTEGFDAADTADMSQADGDAEDSAPDATIDPDASVDAVDSSAEGSDVDEGDPDVPEGDLTDADADADADPDADATPGPPTTITMVRAVTVLLGAPVIEVTMAVTDGRGNAVGAGLEAVMTINSVTVSSGTVGPVDGSETIETDEIGQFTFELSIETLVSEPEDESPIIVATAEVGDATGDVSARVLAPADVVAAVDLPSHFVLAPSSTALVAVAFTDSDDRPLPGIVAVLSADDEAWVDTEAVAGEDGVAMLSLVAPAINDSETAIGIGLSTDLELFSGFAMAHSNWDPDDLWDDSIEFGEFSETYWLGHLLVFYEEVEFADEIVRCDFYLIDVEERTLAQPLAREGIGYLSDYDFFNDRFIYLESYPLGSDRSGEYDQYFYDTIEQSLTLMDRRVLYGTDGLLYTREEVIVDEETVHRLLRFEAGSDPDSAEVVLETPREAEWKAECDGAVYFQYQGDSYALQRFFDGEITQIGADDHIYRVQIRQLDDSAGNCLIFLHDFSDDPDDALYMVQPIVDDFEHVLLMTDHNPNVLVAGADLSFIVVENWDNNVLSRIDLDGDEPLTEDLTGELERFIGNGLNLSPAEDWGFAVADFLRSTADIFAIPIDGSGPDVPRRISLVPDGDTGQQTSWRDSDIDADGTQLVFRQTLAADDSIMGAFAVDLDTLAETEDPAYYAIGPEGEGVLSTAGQGYSTAAYDTTGRWLMLAGDPETLDTHSVYIIDRDEEARYVIHTEESEGDVRAYWSEDGLYLYVESPNGVTFLDVEAVIEGL